MLKDFCNEGCFLHSFMAEIASESLEVRFLGSQEWGVSFEQGQGEIWGALVLSILIQWERGKIKRVAGSFISTEPLSHDNNTQEHTHTHTHTDPNTCELTQLPFAISHPAQPRKPIFEAHIDFLNQTVTKCRHYIHLYLWQCYWAKRWVY